MATVAERIFDPENGLECRERSGLWCFLTAPASRGAISKNTVTKYRRLAAALGVAAVEMDSQAVTVRLDFESGREVLRVA